MKYYQFPNSHSCAKVTILIYEKGLKVEMPVIDLAFLKSREFLQVSPTGKVPFLLEGKFGIPESQIIAEYLEEKYPTPSLLHESLEDRTRARLLCRLHDIHITPLISSVYVPLLAGGIKETKLNDQHGLTQLAKVHVELEKIEKMISPHPYLVGDRFSLADATFILTCWYAEYCGKQYGNEFTKERYPKLGSWYAMIKERPSARRLIADCRAVNGLPAV